MPSTNGQGPKTAVLYARVSTDEQARSGYSLAQQLEALREYAACEGYDVLEEVSDPGQSGASLEPLMFLSPAAANMGQGRLC
jgi:DNA invertase Pin-like site-specific DNA recombinase